MMLTRRQSLIATLGLPLATLPTPSARGDEKLAGKACRSVHLGFNGSGGDLFYNEVAVEKSAPGTYFCSSGFRQGYFGVQELANGKKVVIFSVWDPGQQDNPNSVPAEKRVKLLAKGEKTRVGRFGGEGTGGQSFLDTAWNLGETLRFLVSAKREAEDRIAYTGWYSAPGTNGWKLIASFATLSSKGLLSGYYSFVEDFKRNGESLKQERKARFGNTWIRTAEGEWEAVKKARFTADSNPSKAIDAGFENGRWFLATGGEVTNKTNPLGTQMPATAVPESPPRDLPQDPFALKERI